MKLILIAIIMAVAANFYFANNNFPKEESTVYNVDDTLTVIKPEGYYTLEDQLINTMLSRYHYKKYELDDSLSSVIFNRFIKSIDFGKSYFLASDIKSFEKYRYKLDDDIKIGTVEPFYDMFNLYLRRMNERIVYIDTILSKEFDYSKDEKFRINRENAPWASSVSELNDIWRKRIKNDALNLKLAGKSWDEIKKNLTKRYENYDKIMMQYHSEDVFQLAMNAYTQSIDPHTNYLSPITSDNFKIDMSLSLEGIGARLQYDDGYTKIVEIIPGGPAFKSKKLHVDDKITAVAQGDTGTYVDVVGWRITDVVQLIRGPKGTTVRLQILPADKGLNGEPFELKLIRDKIKLEDQSAKSSVLDVENNGKKYKLGVITIPKFYSDFEGEVRGDKDFKSTSKDVEKLLDELKTKNVSGVIIDLRNDGGGSLEEAIKVTGLFIKDGPVVQVRHSNGEIDIDTDTDSTIVYDGPLAVLINRFSASASEIFAGAIQNYERGVIIGENSYGKGTVQNMIDLNRITNGRGYKFGQLKLTIAKFYRIDGSSTQRVGVKPDIEFPSIVDPEEFGESSEPSALPWDKIAPTKYIPFTNLSEKIPELKKLSKSRTDTDPEFDYIREDIKEYREAKDKIYVSLNEEVRKAEKEKQEEKRFQRENERRKKKGLKLIKKGEKPTDSDKEKVDAYLNESAHIVTDLISLTTG